MTELFRSAFNYLSSTPTNATVIGRSDHPLVGTTVDIDGTKLKIRSLIAEGGYALVFSAQDMQGNWFALKRQLAADQDAAKTILKEIRFLKELSDLPAILHFVQAARLSPQESGHGRAEFLLLTELCPGSVINLIQKGPLSLSQVTKIFYAACIAIKQMHSKKPPITHRDMKVENLLFDAFGNVKLCDFGSATTEIILPDETWSVSKRTQLEEEFARHTTPMYRAPELLDTYSNFPVGPALDIWALGCVLYYLCYRKHPFEDSAKLRIINAKYSLPNSETEFTIMHQLIQKTLKVDPRERPLINDLCERIEKLAVTLAVDLSKPIENLQLPLLSPVSSNHGQLLTESHRNERERSSSISKLSPSLSRKIDYEQTAQQASAMFGAFKGQSMLWLKNIKDKTTAVAQTVQSTYGHRGPDVTFVTSRLVMAPLFDAVPESLICHAEEIVWDYVMNQTRGHLGVYNLSNRHLRCDYGFHVVETPLPTVGSGLTPTVNVLLNLCRNMTIFLKEKKTNIIFITGSEASCLLVSAALLLYTRLVSRPLSALELIFTKRRPYKLLPSYYRQLDIISTVVSLESRCLRIIVHNRRVILHSLSISPVPLFNRARTGCRPFVDMYCDGRKVWSTYKNYEELKLFDVSNSSVLELSLESIAVEAEVQIIVFHARWSKIQNRMQQLFMFSLSFHASFIDPNTHLLELNRSDIDYQIDDNSKFGESMRIGVKMEIDVRDRGYDTKKLPAFLSYDSEAIPNVLLTSQREEFDSLMRCIDCHHCKSSKSPPQRPPPPQKRITCKEKETESSIVTPLKDSFFSTLDWHDGTTSMKDTQCVFVAEAREENLQQPELIPSLQNQLPHEKFSNNDIAKLCEQTDGIKISVVEEGMSSHHHKSDLQKQFETMDKSIPENFNDDVDLLGLGAELDYSVRMLL
ncbi:unnamed protein product [Thelazia callipaeda]|uniref:Protein kinase domain-containing protein n=1 Tax=Thelazia callipaeda TaxID=103827 RepID=A0A0N5CPY2_THECL|nr:unnamed protein product [Thelazia callipaeda]